MTIGELVVMIGERMRRGRVGWGGVGWGGGWGGRRKEGGGGWVD